MSAPLQGDSTRRDVPGIKGTNTVGDGIQGISNDTASAAQALFRAQEALRRRLFSVTRQAPRASQSL